MSPSDTQGLTRDDVRQVFELYSARQLDGALQLARQLAKRYPDQPVLLNMLGAIYTGLDQGEAAIANYQRALQVGPASAQTHYHLASVLRNHGRRGEALEHLRQATLLAPDMVEAHGAYCQELERANQLEQLDTALAAARSACPGEHPELTLRDAQLRKRRCQPDAARTLLETPPKWQASPQILEERAHMLADLCDLSGDYSLALGYASEANKLTAQSPQARAYDGDQYFMQLAMLEETFNEEWLNNWSTPELTDPRPDPVFLVGFPRSGTTLVDTILRSHPGIAVAEEKPALRLLETAVSALPGGYPAALATLDRRQLESLRQRYFKELDKHVPLTQRNALLIDKLPLNLVHAGLIQRVFPNARFLFALRDPRDCVLSCYLRPFKMNEAMVNFLDLQRTAKLYDRAMTLWCHYERLLSPNTHYLRYEALTADFDATLAPLLQFLGLPWDDQLRNYRETALARSDIDTPSYNQVTEPLYQSARGRWRQYPEAMTTVDERLSPWVAHWEYER